MSDNGNWYDLFDLSDSSSDVDDAKAKNKQENKDPERLLERAAEVAEVDGMLDGEEIEADGALGDVGDIPLFDFQENAVKVMTTMCPPHARSYLCLLADEQGMGKTRQLIAAAVRLDDLSLPAVVFAPANLCGKWEEDVRELAPQHTVKQSGKLNQAGWWEGADFVIISYSNSTKADDVYLPPDGYFHGFLADETHFLKNPKAARTELAYLIRASCPYACCFLASGTPIYSRPSDLITQIELLGQLKCFGGAGRFRRNFAATYNGSERAKNPGVLHQMLKKYCNMIRRTKDGRLTPKTRSLIPVELPQHVIEEYRALMAEANRLRQNKEMYLGAITRVRQCLSMAKVDWMAAWIADFMEKNPDRPLIAMGFFVDALEALAKRFPGAATYYGKTPKKKKEQIRKDFQAGKYKLFLGNFVSAGVGLDLYKSADVVFFDLPWTASELFQAEDRAHRFGQTKEVTVHIPYFEHTRDERQIRAIVGRAKDAKLVVDGQVWTPESFLEASRGADGDMLGP